MASIIDSFQLTFRDFETPNLPSSGQRKVWKADARALGGVIEQAVNLIANGVVIGSATLYATKAAMDADYATGAVGRLALVYADSTAANNKIWVKGASAWVDAGMTLAASAVAQLADLAARMSAAETRLTTLEAFQTRDILLDSGSTGDAIVGTVSGAAVAAATLLASSALLIYRPTATNTTTTPTLQLNGDSQGRIIRDLANVGLKIGDFEVGRDYILIPDGARYRLVNPGTGTLRAADLTAAIASLIGAASGAGDDLGKLEARIASEVLTRGNSDAGLQASINAINTALAGLTVGEEVQAFSAKLTALAALTYAANKLIYSTGASAFATTDLTAFARTILDDGDAETARATLGVAVGSDVQAYDATLAALAGLSVAANKLIYATGPDAFATSDLSVFARTILDDADAAAVRTTLGLVLGTNVQAFDQTLTALAGVTTAANKLIYATGVDTFATADFSAFARQILDDADAAAVRTTLGLGNVDNTADANKPVSAAQAEALNLKADASVVSVALAGKASTTDLATETDTRIARDAAIEGKADLALGRTTPLVDYPADASVRPGKNPALFTSALTGRASATAPFSAADVVATSYGEAIQKTGPFVVAPRDPRAIIDDHIYRVTFIVSDDTPGGVAVDPQGDTMRFALRWLNGNYATIATRVAEDKALAAADGNYVKTVVMSKLGTEGQNGVDIVIPPTARHFREFVESFSGNRTRTVHVLCVEDVTNGVVLSGDVAALSSAVSQLQASKVPTTRTLTTSGLVKGGGGLDTDRDFRVDPATAADIAAGTATDKAATPAALKPTVDKLAAVDAAGAATTIRIGNLEILIKPSAYPEWLLLAVDAGWNVVWGIRSDLTMSNPDFDAVKALALLFAATGIRSDPNELFLLSVPDPNGWSLMTLFKDGEFRTITTDRHGAQIEELTERVDELDGGGGGGSSKVYDPFPPAVAYGKVGDLLPIYSEGIIVDRSLDLVWSVPYANDKVARIVPETTDPIPVKLQTFDEENQLLDLAEFDVLVTGTPVSPSVPLNIIGIGDSKTYGAGTDESGATVEGAYLNELSRLLTGIGTALMSGAQSPASLGLSNIYFRGTLGNQPVKHEGRAGWEATKYLHTAAVGSVTNAFFDPATQKFSIDYYLTQNAWRSSDTATGVLPDGSNLCILLWIVWNDAYTQTPTSSADEVAEIIDLIHAQKPLAKVVVMGVGNAPKTMWKFFTGSRLVSQRAIWETIVKPFGRAYKAVCDARPNAEFFPLAPFVDADLAFMTTAKTTNVRSADTLTGAGDYVHESNRGYAMVADALRNLVLYHYCRGS